ncbi:MAG TPA: pitrilysin family protein [Candidatus Saccharimonadales bacterium]|jgi:predicted Zn-dependent peptidase|nr:pitrilysin family protein [Candidatus Saccharimonadales bacterium]
MKHTVEEVRLKNGARGLLIDIPGATVMSFQFQFRAGNRYVRNKDIYETAHIMEHMAFGSNANYKSEHEYEADFTKNGAYHNAYTSDLSMVYVADCADFEWDRIFALQRVAICQPKFNAEELEAEKGNVKSELTGYLNNHNRVLWPKIQQLLGEDVYTFWQRLQTIPNVTLADIREHHKRTHTAKNMCFVIAGKLTGRKAEIKRQLEDWELPEGERFEVPKDELSGGNPTLIRRKEASNLTFGLSMTVPRELTDEEAEAMNCLDQILTGTMHSRIYGAARKKGLAYGVFSDASVGFHDSSWDFGGQVNLETSGALFDIIVREIKHVLDGKITEDELAAAKSYALGRYQMGAQTVAQISNFYTGRYFADGIVKDYEKVPDSIRKTTRECIINTARGFIESNAWVLAGVSSGEKEDIVELNEKLATLFEKK